MIQMTEAIASKLSPTQAAELTRVVELEARWENLGKPGAKAGPGFSVSDLHAKQRAYDALRTCLKNYEAKYQPVHMPEVPRNNPARLGEWCRTLRALLRRVEADGGVSVPAPVQLVAKAYGLADRIATRLKEPLLDRGTTADSLSAAIAHLDGLISWCDRHFGPPVALSIHRPVADQPLHREAA